MSTLKFSVKKRSTIIVLVILFLIVGGSGGYLLYRINQEDTVAPIDSEAGGGGGGEGVSCCSCPTGGKSSACDDNESPLYNCTCGFDNWCPSLPRCATKKSGKDCDVPACVWPSVSWWLPDAGEGNCACAPRTTYDANPDLRCDDTMPRCTPPACPEGYIDMHVPGGGTAFEPSNYSAENLALIQAAKLFDHKTRIVCVANGSDELCFTECGPKRCLPCENPYWVRRMCKKAPPAPTCGDGTVNQTTEECDPPGSTCSNGQTCTSDCKCPATPPPTDNTCDPTSAGWLTDPTAGGRMYETCKDEVKFSYRVADPQGVDLSSIKVTVNGTAVSFTKNPTTGTPTTATVSGTLNTATSCLSAGAKTIKIVWKDKNGNPKSGESPCMTERTFTITPKNICDAIGAKWNVPPTNSIVYGKTIPFEYITADRDGVQNANIKVVLDGNAVTGLTKIPATANDPKITVKGTIPTSMLTVGDHKLEISWNDVKGNGGIPCYVYALIKVVPQDPDWDIGKESVEACLDDGSENPISKVTNTITITNKNETTGAVGIISEITDTLDTKVDGETVVNISDGGIYEDGKITWNLTSPLSDFNPGESKTFTYSYTVAKEAFGTYDNVAIATTSTNTTLEAGARIEARCNIADEPPTGDTVPDTGLFDESENLVVMGAILLFLGLGWTWLNRTYEVVNGKLVERNKEKFERRIVRN